METIFEQTERIKRQDAKNREKRLKKGFVNRAHERRAMRGVKRNNDGTPKYSTKHF